MTSQLSNKLEERKDKRPKITDFSYHVLEDDIIDIIIFLYREDYYNDINETKSIMELNIAKNRLVEMESLNYYLIRNALNIKI